ncbi:MAG: hypothetical protein JO345_08280 [Streptosporangiaceae bacterium]|nr:hypothetical protein [Streptosporangiaceae bacterium]
MDSIALAAATALVGAMATNAWQQVSVAVVAWWRRAHPGQADAVSADLKVLRVQVLAVRERGDEVAERALADSWRLQLQRLLEENPALTPGLRRLLDEHLSCGVPPDEQPRVGQMILNARARGQARQYIAGRDMNIAES